MVVLVLCLALLLTVASGQPNPPTIQFIRKPTLSNYGGYWLAVGDAIPFAIMNRNGSLPDCAAYAKAGNYHLHYSEDVHATVIYGADPNAATHHLMTIGHRRTSLAKIVSLEGYRLTFQNVRTGVQSCAHYRPYVDQATGHLEALTVFGTEYNRLSNGTVTAKSLTCSLKGTERAGCYRINSSTVRYYGYGKLRCMNGECALISPYWKQVDEAE